MASRERELLPCPFCGATAVCTPDQGGNYTVFCHQFCVSTDTSKDVDELVAIWNRRAALAEGAREDEPVAREPTMPMLAAGVQAYRMDRSPFESMAAAWRAMWDDARKGSQ